MKNVEIDDDLYAYLLKKAIRIGESASEIIRREIGYPVAHTVKTPASGEVKFNGITKDETELFEFLQSPTFQTHRQIVDRFLPLLAWLHEHHSERFKIALDIRGRSRKYFALTERELVASGDSTNPKRIPRSPYWVVTNNETPRKKKIIRELMQLLGYGLQAVERAEAVLEAAAPKPVIYEEESI